MDATTHAGISPTELTDPYCDPPIRLAARLAGHRWRRLAVVGDSIAAGVGDPVDGYRDLGWADMVHRALEASGGRVELRNSGVPGQVAADIRDAQLHAALAFRPDLAVVTGGGNDMLADGFEPAAVEWDMAQVVGQLRSFGATVITFGLFDVSRTGVVPPSMSEEVQDRIRRLNAATERLSRRLGAVFVDHFDHPALESGIIGVDGLHPNRRGHAVVATEVVRALAGRLAAQRQW